MSMHAWWVRYRSLGNYLSIQKYTLTHSHLIFSKGAKTTLRGKGRALPTNARKIRDGPVKDHHHAMAHSGSRAQNTDQSRATPRRKRRDGPRDAGLGRDTRSADASEDAGRRRERSCQHSRTQRRPISSRPQEGRGRVSRSASPSSEAARR